MIIFNTGNYLCDSFNQRNNPLILNTAKALLCSKFCSSGFFLSTCIILYKLNLKIHL